MQRTILPTAFLGIVVAFGAAACGTTDEASRMTLPPLETTTTTTTTTTTISVEPLYTVEPGDSLTAIAAERGVTVQAILEANPRLESQDDILAGDVIEIPAPE